MPIFNIPANTGSAKNLVKQITVPADGWANNTNPYVQSISVSEIQITSNITCSLLVVNDDTQNDFNKLTAVTETGRIVFSTNNRITNDLVLALTIS